MELVPDGARHAMLSLGAGAETVPSARRFVLDHLRAWGLPTVVLGDAALVATELVTNALRHGPPPVLLDVAMTADRVRIAVQDSSHEVPSMLPATTDAESGRGLGLLQALGVAWGSDQTQPGKSVWCELLGGA